MVDAKSIIVVGMPCNKKIPKRTDDEERGYISITAVREDYHRKLRNLLEKLVEILGANNEKNQNFKYEINVDTGPLNERSLAIKAGLGKLGRNQCVISEKFGSLFFIGYIITNANYEIHESTARNSQHENCANCTNCVKACPGNALEFGFNYKVCRSYLTQKKEKLTVKERKIIGNSIYGCDICQMVCPCNKNIAGEEEEEDEVYPKLDKFENMSNKMFKEEYGLSGIFWRGKKVIKRNAEIVKENNRTERK